MPMWAPAAPGAGAFPVSEVDPRTRTEQHHVTPPATRRPHQRRAPHQRPDPRPRGAPRRSQRRAGRHRRHRRRAAAGPGGRPRPGRGRADGPPAGLQAHGLRQVQVRDRRRRPARRARTRSHTVIKEMKLRPKIDPHDYETKKGHVVRFLKAGRQGQDHDHVPRTRAVPARARASGCCSGSPPTSQELGFVESAPKQDGRNMIMVLGPHKKKADADGRGQRDAGAPRPSDGAGRRREPRPRRPPRRRRGTDAAPRRRAPAESAGLSGRSTAPSRPATAERQYRARPPRPRATTRRHGAMPKMKTHSGAKKRFRSPAPARSCASRPTAATCSRTSRRRRTRRLAADVGRRARGHARNQAPARHLTPDARYVTGRTDTRSIPWHA